MKDVLILEKSPYLSFYTENINFPYGYCSNENSNIKICGDSINSSCYC